MNPKDFIERFQDAFGAVVALPIAVGRSDNAAAEVSKLPKCMIGSISKVRNGKPLTLTTENVTCGGGGLYAGFRPMPERVPLFVSETEHYKRTPAMVRDYVAEMNIEIAGKSFLNFRRVDTLEDWSEVEALIFFATPDVFSGLCTWAFYDNNAADAVSAPFASGCAAIITFALNENAANGRRCFLGMFDPSARPLVPENELTFTVPMSRMSEMLDTMNDSALFQKAFAAVRARINRS